MGEEARREERTIVTEERPWPLRPRRPERFCWGCDRLCRGDDLRCGNGKIRAAHPFELFGEEWAEEQERQRATEGTPAP